MFCLFFCVLDNYFILVYEKPAFPALFIRFTLIYYWPPFCSNVVDVSSYNELKEAISQGKWARGPWSARYAYFQFLSFVDNERCGCIFVHNFACFCMVFFIVFAVTKMSWKLKKKQEQQLGAFLLNSHRDLKHAWWPVTLRRKLPFLQSLIEI